MAEPTLKQAVLGWYQAAVNYASDWRAGAVLSTSMLIIRYASLHFSSIGRFTGFTARVTSVLEAVNRDGGGLYALISSDPADIWRELRAL